MNQNINKIYGIRVEYNPVDPVNHVKVYERKWKMPKADLTDEKAQQWELINPEGLVKIEPVEPAPRPGTLENKTVVMRWNGKANGDLYLNRVGDLLAEKVPGVNVIRLWEKHLSTACISQSPEESMGVARKIADLGADIVIGTNAD